MILDLVRRRCCDRQSRMTINPLCRPLTVFPARVNRNLFEFSITNNHARRARAYRRRIRGDAQPFDAAKKLTQAPDHLQVEDITIVENWKSTKDTPATRLKIIDHINP